MRGPHGGDCPLRHNCSNREPRHQRDEEETPEANNDSLAGLNRAISTPQQAAQHAHATMRLNTGKVLDFALGPAADAFAKHAENLDAGLWRTYSTISDVQNAIEGFQYQVGKCKGEIKGLIDSAQEYLSHHGAATTVAKCHEEMAKARLGRHACGGLRTRDLRLCRRAQQTGRTQACR
jgi:hypothetical protein